MPVVLIVAGSLLLIAAVRNTQQQLYLLVADDFTGKNNFIFWFLSIVVIGAVGYIPKMKPVSDGFLVLVILTLFLKKGTGFFDAFQRQVGATQSSTPAVSTSSGGTTTTGGTNIVRLGTGGGINVNLPPPTIGIGGGGVTIGI